MIKFLNKFIIVTGIILMMSVSVYANFLRMEMNSDFSNIYPPKEIKLKLIKDVFLYDEVFFMSNTIINCDITDVSEPKRLKRSASFTCTPVNYAREGEEVKNFDVKLKIKFVKLLNKKEMTINAATTVASTAANHIVPGLGIGIKAVEEAAEAKNGSRLKAALHGAWESTPFSYIEKGNDLDLNSGDIIFVKVSKK